MFGIAEHLGKGRKHVSTENVSSEELCCFIVWDVRVVWSAFCEYPWDIRLQTHLRQAMKNRCFSRSKSILAVNTDVRCTDVLLCSCQACLLVQVIYSAELQLTNAAFSPSISLQFLSSLTEVVQSIKLMKMQINDAFILLIFSDQQSKTQRDLTCNDIQQKEQNNQHTEKAETFLSQKMTRIYETTDIRRR